jgi:hypothetical protein
VNSYHHLTWKKQQHTTTFISSIGNPIIQLKFATMGNSQALHIVKDVMVVFREAFFIHPSICPIIHPRRASYKKKTLAEINNLPPSAHVSLSRKGMPGLGGHPQNFDINIVVNFLFKWHLGYICCLRSFTMVSCMLLSHRSQAMQTSRFSMARVLMNTCGMWYMERF